MKTKFTLKRLIISCIVFALGLMTLLTLCIPLLKLDDPIIDRIISMNLLNIKTYESGFTLLDFESSVGMDEEMAIACGIFALLQLFLSISTMVLAVLCIFLFDNKLSNKILKAFVISCLVFIGLYMVWGFIFSGIYKYLEIYETGGWGLYDHYDKYAYYSTTTYTLAYLGFIFGALFLVAYIVCTLKLKDDMAWKKNSDKDNNATVEEAKNETPQIKEQNHDNLTQASQIAEALKQYKDLLDSGIITQKEFDKKKQEILN